MSAPMTDPCDTGACDHPEHVTAGGTTVSEEVPGAILLALSTAEGTLVEDVMDPATFVPPQMKGLPEPSLVIEFCDRVGGICLWSYFGYKSSCFPSCIYTIPRHVP